MTFYYIDYCSGSSRSQCRIVSWHSFIPHRRFTVLVKLVGDVKWHVCMHKGCTKEFKKPSDLVRHMRIHTNDKPFKVVRVVIVIKNSTYHIDDIPIQRSWSYVKWSFSGKCAFWKYLILMTIHTVFQCNKCFRNFAVKSTLMAHMKTHLAVKDHTCKHCEKKFATATSLRVHTWYASTNLS